MVHISYCEWKPVGCLSPVKEIHMVTTSKRETSLFLLIRSFASMCWETGGRRISSQEVAANGRKFRHPGSIVHLSKISWNVLCGYKRGRQLWKSAARKCSLILHLSKISWNALYGYKRGRQLWKSAARKCSLIINGKQVLPRQQRGTKWSSDQK